MPITDILLSLLANLGWGFNFIAGKYGAEHFQPLFFTSLRFFFLLLLMLPWLKPAPGYMKPLLRVAFLLGVLHFSMMFMGIYTCGNIASIAIASQLYVPFSAMLAAIFLKEKITPLRIVAITIAMAVATILMRQCPNLGVFKLQAWIALIAAPSLLGLSLIFENDQLEILQASRLIDFWTPVYSAIAASIIGHGIVYYLLGRHPVSVVTPLMLLSPVFATAFGVMLFGDNLGLKMIIGGVLTLAGVVLTSVNPAAIRQHKILSGKKK